MRKGKQLTPQIFTITELTSRIRDRLESDLRLHDLWAQGELSNVVNHRSGHRYFTLKDHECQISCVLFRNHGLSMGFELKDGLNVLVFGDVGFYGPKSQVQLVARGMRLDSGFGFRHREFERIKQKLSAEGLFDLERKRPLPSYPNCIGIVTSPNGAALRDVLHTFIFYPIRIILSPAQVQGDGAEESIASAIRALKVKTDVVIVCRGGGSAEDLWAFNSELVARAIFECDAPVISAIGHETNYTIADFVADVRAPTPTAAAKMAIPDLEKLRENLRINELRMSRALWSSLESKQYKLDYLHRSLSSRKMYELLAEYSQRIDYLAEHLELAEKEQLKMLRQKLEMLGSRLSSVSPFATLSRGYAIALSFRGNPISGSEEVSPGDIFELLLYNGKLRCMVLNKDESR
jgi:exodeoxyribonuclease VII large subunit